MTLVESAAHFPEGRPTMTTKTLLLALGLTAALAAAFFVTLSAETVAQTADLVLRNGRVVTVDSARPEAQAVAIVGDRIAAVGTNEEIAGMIGPRTEVIDLGGKLVIPGFIEAHGHFLSLGHSKTIL